MDTSLLENGLHWSQRGHTHEMHYEAQWRFGRWDVEKQVAADTDDN